METSAKAPSSPERPRTPEVPHPHFGKKGTFSTKECLIAVATATRLCYRLSHASGQPELLHKAPALVDLKEVKKCAQAALGANKKIEEVSPGQHLEETIIELHKIREEQTPFYVVDLAVPVRMYETWRRLMPRVEPHYAVKCNPDRGIVAALVACGCGFDCASPFEIGLALELGASPSKVIYANPCKHPAYIAQAAALGVHRMTFDNEMEIDKMLEQNPKAELVLRLAIKGSHALIDFSSKFGASIDEAKRCIRLCKKKNAKLIGCSFHVGTPCFDVTTYDIALNMVKEVFEFAKTLGFNLYFVDIGGGWPGADIGDNLPEAENPEDHVHPEAHKSGVTKIPAFSEFAIHVSKLLDRLFPDDPKTQGVRYEIVAEPGRYFATEAVTHACSVIAKRPVYRTPMPEGQGPDKLDLPSGSVVGYKYYLSDGVYGSMNCALTDHVKPVPRVLFSSNPEIADTTKWVPCTFFGPTCDSLDTINTGVWTPELNVGDWVYHRMFGAYTMTLFTRFNGFPEPAVFYVITTPKPL